MFAFGERERCKLCRVLRSRYHEHSNFDLKLTTTPRSQAPSGSTHMSSISTSSIALWRFARRRRRRRQDRQRKLEGSRAGTIIKNTLSHARLRRKDGRRWESNRAIIWCAFSSCALCLRPVVRRRVTHSNEDASASSMCSRTRLEMRLRSMHAAKMLQSICRCCEVESAGRTDGYTSQSDENTSREWS